MSTIYYDNHLNQQPLSLIERKKQQWAKEKEELAGLNENAPWGSRDSLQFYDRPNIKSRYVTKYQKETEYLRRDSSYSTASSTTSNGTPRRQQHTLTAILPPPSSQRIPGCLPPLYKNQNFTYSPDPKSDKEMGGETSGYGSDNAPRSPEHLPRADRPSATNWPPQHAIHPHNIINNPAHLNGYESSSSGREDRLRWGDRGVHLANKWDGIKTIDSHSDTTPGWVKRGLERDTEVVIVNNSSPAESPEQDYGERPCTSSSVMTNRCFIRGQNVHIEPAELAERERRRQVALEHQEAIRQQLEEREKRKQEEQQRRIREEYEEERRIAREQDIARQRQEQQDRIRQEKEERERKRKEALMEAIQIAEKEAKEEKLKLRLMRQNQLNTLSDQFEKTIDKDNDIKTIKNQNNQQQQLEDKHTEKFDIGKENIDKVMLENRKNSEEKTKEVSSSENDLENKQLVVSKNNQETPAHSIISNSNSDNSDTVSMTNSINSMPSSTVHHPNPLQILQGIPSLTQDNLGLLLQGETLQNVQFVLIPTIATIPMSLASGQIPMTLSSAAQTQLMSTTRTENRLLTPTQYRNRKPLTCDSSTQTEKDRDRELCDKIGNIEICYETTPSRSRKDRRSRSEMRHGEIIEAQERPKWGVNRPPTRYLKQSEKDPNYQRRKMRQKIRQNKTYDDKRYSSDDSQTGSPRTYRKKRGMWRKDDALYSENVKVYQTEIIPLESDKDHIYFRAKAHHQCCCRCVGSGPGPGYQNYKEDREKERERPRVDIMKIESPREYRDKLPICNNNNSNSLSLSGEENILDKLSSIHNDLMLKDNWEERSQALYSPSRNP